MVTHEPLQQRDLLARPCARRRHLSESKSGDAGQSIGIEQLHVRISKYGCVETLITTAADICRSRALVENACMKQRQAMPPIEWVGDDNEQKHSGKAPKQGGEKKIYEAKP